MVQIRWEQCGIAKKIQHDVQEVALCANLSAPLFKETKQNPNRRSYKQRRHIKIYGAGYCITTIMQESLKMEVEINCLHGARVSSLNDAARKMYVQSAQRETKLSH